MTSVERWKKEHPEELAALLRACDYRCVLCRKKFGRGRPYALDHRHMDGLVRGVPCSMCNERLGVNHDDAGWFSRAAAYLDLPPAIDQIGAHYVPGSLGAARQEM